MNLSKQSGNYFRKSSISLLTVGGKNRDYTNGLLLQHIHGLGVGHCCIKKGMSECQTPAIKRKQIWMQ